MEQLRKIGGLCRQHYEKIILSAALIGLAAAVWYLSSVSEQQSAEVQTSLDQVVGKKTKGVAQEDLTNFVASLTRIEKAEPFVLAPPHNLFNPVEWQTNRVSGDLRRIRAEEEVGAERLEFTNVTALTLTIGFGKPVGQGENVSSYQLPITNLVARRPVIFPVPVVSVGATNPQAPFYLREVKGPPGAPEEFVIELKDTGEKASVTPARPFVRVESYLADLVYPLERNAVFARRKAGDVLHFAGKDFKISEIKSNEVVVVSPKNKPTTLRLKP